MQVALLCLLAAALLAATGCGGDAEGGGEAQPAEGTQAPPSVPREVPTADLSLKQAASKWARLFGSGDRSACDYWFGTATPCEKLYMKRPLSRFVRSFRGAEVKRVKPRRDRAVVTFSNGERVIWIPAGARDWLIDNVLGGEQGGKKSGGNSG